MKQLAAALVCLGALVACSPATAVVTWNWSFSNGAEAGSFQTNGTLADLAASFNFQINVSTFVDTASAFAPALVGATFTENEPTQGFLWNGIAPTQWYRASGASTNGSNFTAGTLRITFGISGMPANSVGFVNNNVTLGNTGFQALTLAPVTAPVPEPAATLMFALGAAVLGTLRWRSSRG